MFRLSKLEDTKMCYQHVIFLVLNTKQNKKPQPEPKKLQVPKAGNLPYYVCLGQLRKSKAPKSSRQVFLWKLTIVQNSKEYSSQALMAFVTHG